MQASGGAVKGYVQEIFYSVQGEGLWAGRLQHFVRFKGCDVGCRFCDTPLAIFRTDDAGRGPGAETFANPLDAAFVCDILGRQIRRRPGAHSIALTGGEPLQQAAFLEDLLALIEEKCSGMPVLLETAGLHFEEMGRLSGKVDMVSMDFKLPSTSGLHGTRERHERFLGALGGRAFYVKAVVDQRTPRREVAEAARTVALRDRAAPFFLQPVTREGRVWGGAYLIDLWSAARSLLEDVRVMPQVHKSLGLS